MFKFFVALMSVVLAVVARAEAEIQCNKKQTKCLTENVKFSIGDQVGIFNRNGEMVAQAEVTGIRGEKRSLTVGKRSAQIQRSHRLALLDENKAFTTRKSVESYTVYKKAPENEIGASLGLGNSSIGAASPTAEVSGFGAWRWLEDSQFIFRGLMQKTEGTVGRYGKGDVSYERAPISFFGIGVLGGVSHTMFRQQPVSLRSEVAAGMMYASATVDGSASLVSGNGYDCNIENGIQPLFRGSVGGAANFDGWKLTGDFVASLANEAFTQMLSVGFSLQLGNTD